MSTEKHRQSHYFEIFNLFGLAIILIAVITFQEQMNATVVTMFTFVYFMANIIYAAKTHHLDVQRVVEVGLIAFLCEFIILNYII